MAPPTVTKPTITPPPPTLDEDITDDLLYFSRTNELSDLKETITTLSTSLNRYPLEISAAAVDEYSGNTCLHMAAANNHVQIVEYILSLEAPPIATPPAPAAADADVITVPTGYLNTLLNFPNESGNTPLHWACLNGHIDTVKVLVKAGADPGVLNAAGHDCVYEAEVNDKSEVVEWVLNFAEGLESGVGVVGDDEKGEEDEGKDNAEVLRDEGGSHREKVEGGEVKEEGDTAAAIGKLEIEDKEPTIR
ncbi:hypothetical protein TWF481_004461 [Arthrobotrys musiformis]|uniref:Ankyrin n=1 Tax=Arthrobotrys musiformis TaxID=47236 RepID=A0AAV9WKK9_9PEZI